MLYEMIDGLNLEDFNNIINDRLQHGWKLYGNPIVVIDDRRISYFQAVVKDD